MNCPLCRAMSRPFLTDYFRCPNCDLVSLSNKKWLHPEEEKKRYLTHNNDVDDFRYQNFVRPLSNVIESRVTPGASGLDFGAGTGPVLAKLLREKSYEVELYDPFFWSDEAVLHKSYDFIVSSEVAEHLREPGQEFLRLRSLLKPGGPLALMTLLLEPGVDFENWYYRRDPTHIAFYSRDTFLWIKEHFQFAQVEFLSSRVVVLS